ncbi:MAG: hypothetical protein K6F31_10945 [Acetatifactor sp.]|nr:hypothetical protein [Acetatifactor sp.]
MSNLKIMDVTLRDGSYAIDFQFSCVQQKMITEGLERLGIEYIEIGHGMGLHASCPENGLALHSDEEYLLTAKETLKKAKYGMFCIPGVARLEDVDMACDLGASFLRIGANVTEIERTEKYIKRAKDHHVFVTTNYMKSYVVSPEEFAEKVVRSESYGADLAYVVDSAGCMTPDELERIYEAVRKRSNLALGFHGHDNTGLAMTNSLKAAELGFEFIDCSLQGMGRSSGNTSTELFAINAKKLGYDVDVDVKEMLKLSKRFVYPLAKKINLIDVMCGYTGFHTSYLRDIHKIAGKYGVDPLELMERYTAIDQVHMDVNKLDEIAKTMKVDMDSFMICDFNGYFGHEQK